MEIIVLLFVILFLCVRVWVCASNPEFWYVLLLFSLEYATHLEVIHVEYQMKFIFLQHVSIASVVYIPVRVYNIRRRSTKILNKFYVVVFASRLYKQHNAFRRS